MIDEEKMEHVLLFECLRKVGEALNVYKWWCSCGVDGFTHYPEARLLVGCPHDAKNIVNKRT